MTTDTTQAGPHPLAHILRAIADGLTTQWRYRDSNVWYDQDPQMTIDLDETYVEWRIEPRTISINGHEVPAPERVEPAMGTAYFCPSIAGNSYASPLMRWNGNKANRLCLARGLVHLTRENAELHARALLSFTENKS